MALDPAANRIDASSDYLNAAARLPAVAAMKKRTYGLMEIGEGSRVLDVGCGPGIDTVALAGIVGATGRVDGIDIDPTMIAAADEAAAAAGIGGQIKHTVSRSGAMPFEDATFDACRAERLLQHLNPAQIERTIGEIKRVTKPGGRVVMADTDWGTLSMSSASELERRIVSIYRGFMANPYAGRNLLRYLNAMELEEIRVEQVAIGLDSGMVAGILEAVRSVGVRRGEIQIDHIEAWREGFELSVSQGVFQAHVMMVVGVGRCG